MFSLQIFAHSDNIDIHIFLRYFSNASNHNLTVFCTFELNQCSSAGDGDDEKLNKDSFSRKSWFVSLDLAKDFARLLYSQNFCWLLSVRFQFLASSNTSLHFQQRFSNQPNLSFLVRLFSKEESSHRRILTNHAQRWLCLDRWKKNGKSVPSLFKSMKTSKNNIFKVWPSDNRRSVI